LIILMALTFIFFGTANAASTKLNELIKAAEKEGTVAWVGVINEKEASPFVKAFEKKYPKIKVEFERQHGGQAMERLIREYHSGHIQHDVVQIHPDSLHEFIKIDAIEKVDWASLGVLPDIILRDNRFVGIFEGPYCIVYNRNLIKPEEAPKSWDDLLDPKWKGKLVTDTRPSGFLRLTSVWGREKTLDYLRKLARNKPIFVRGQTKAATLMAAGDYMLSAPMYLQSYVIVGEKKGGPLGFNLPNPLPTYFLNYGIIKGAKHPNAGKLLLSWLGSEGYKIMEDINWGWSVPFGGTKKEKLYGEIKDLKLAFPPTDEQVPDRHKWVLEMTKALGVRK